MATDVIMPQLGESVVEGTVTKWLKGEGEPIEEFEPLLEINTDKVDSEIPAPASGTVLKRFVAEGETVRAGTRLAVIGEPGEAIPEAELAQEAAAAQAPQAPAAAVKQPARPKTDLGFISPVVARMAAEHGLDLAQIPGTGRGGRITKKDVLAYLEGRPSAAPWESPASGELFRPTEELFGGEAPAAASALQPGEVIPHSAVRRAIAEHMVQSKRTSPHVTSVMEADMSRVIAHRMAHKPIFARDGVNLTYSAYFVAASVQALKAVPLVNASWTDEGTVLHREVNIGVAVSLGEEGLIVPVVKHADELSLLAIARAVNDLAGRARRRELRPDEVQGGTFTITNHGVGGSLFAMPIINQPQAAILGVGAVKKRVVVLESQTPGLGSEDHIAIRPMVYLTLTIDHRLLDGAVADQFLGHLVQTLERWS